MKHCMAVVSGKGGVGKTFLTAALGLHLGSLGKKVLLVDGDMGLRNLDIPLGIAADATIWDLARGQCFEEEALRPVNDSVDFLAASLQEDWEELSEAALYTVFEDVAGRYDFVLIDCPAGLGAGLRFARRAADRFLVVAAPSAGSLRDASRLLEAGKDRQVSVLLNGFNARGVPVSLSAAAEALGEAHLTGVVPYLIEADRRAQKGQLSGCIGRGVLGEALEMVGKELLSHPQYPRHRWERLLAAAEEENRRARDDRPEPAAVTALFRRQNRMAARWRGKWR